MINRDTLERILRNYHELQEMWIRRNFTEIPVGRHVIDFRDVLEGMSQLTDRQLYSVVLVCIEGLREVDAAKVIIPDSKWSSPIGAYKRAGLEVVCDYINDRGKNVGIDLIEILDNDRLQAIAANTKAGADYRELIASLHSLDLEKDADEIMRICQQAKRAQRKSFVAARMAVKSYMKTTEPWQNFVHAQQFISYTERYLAAGGLPDKTFRMARVSLVELERGAESFKNTAIREALDVISKR